MSEEHEQSKAIIDFTLAMKIKLADRYYLLLRFRRSFNRSFINGNKIHRLHNLKRKMRATSPRGKCFERMARKGLI